MSKVRSLFALHFPCLLWDNCLCCIFHVYCEIIVCIVFFHVYREIAVWIVFSISIASSLFELYFKSILRSLFELYFPRLLWDHCLHHIAYVYGKIIVFSRFLDKLYFPHIWWDLCMHLISLLYGDSLVLPSFYIARVLFANVVSSLFVLYFPCL